jgi:hypothetical protein
MAESYADKAARQGGENEAMGSKEAQRILRNINKKATKRSSKRKSKR